MENIFLWPLFYVEVNPIKYGNHFLKIILQRSKRSLNYNTFRFSEKILDIILNYVIKISKSEKPMYHS